MVDFAEDTAPAVIIEAVAEMAFIHPFVFEFKRLAHER